MEHIYHLDGTFPELEELLQSQFNMTENVAKFSICLLLTEQQQALNELAESNDPHTALWYLNKHEYYTTPIFKSRFSISLTDSKKALLEQLAVQFSGLLIDGDTLAFSTILSCLLAIYRNVTYIKDEECCVYYQALYWKTTHIGQEYFTVQDILPNNIDNVCKYLEFIQDGKWKCNSYHNEKCNRVIEVYNIILNKLCEKNVFIKYNEMYRFTK